MKIKMDGKDIELIKIPEYVEEPEFTTMTKQQLEEFEEWFFSKYPDIEEPLLKKYPEDTRDGVIGEGIFDDKKDYEIHDLFRLSMNKLIREFCNDVMRGKEPYADNYFELNASFIDKHYLIVCGFLHSILAGIGRVDIDKDKFK